MTINPPTGDEQPQKYYSSSYLDEELALKAEVGYAERDGRDVNLEDVNVLTIAAVAPELLTKTQQKEVDALEPADVKAAKAILSEDYEGVTHIEASGDEDWRVDSALDGTPQYEPELDDEADLFSDDESYASTPSTSSTDSTDSTTPDTKPTYKSSLGSSDA